MRWLRPHPHPSLPPHLGGGKKRADDEDVVGLSPPARLSLKCGFLLMPSCRQKELRASGVESRDRAFLTPLPSLGEGRGRGRVRSLALCLMGLKASSDPVEPWVELAPGCMGHSQMLTEWPGVALRARGLCTRPESFAKKHRGAASSSMLGACAPFPMWRQGSW